MIAVDGKVPPSINRARIVKAVAEMSASRHLKLRRKTTVHFIDASTVAHTEPLLQIEKRPVLEAFGLANGSFLPTLEKGGVRRTATDIDIVVDAAHAADAGGRAYMSTIMAAFATALDDQNGLLPVPRRDDDEILARVIQTEGDSTFAEYLGDAAKQGVAEQSAFEWMERDRATSPEDYARGHPEALKDPLSTIFLYRDIFTMGFLSGGPFAARLYREGRFDLLNRALRNPPRSTEQALHLDKYTAGDLPQLVFAPSVPPGWHVREKGTLGELGIRALLEGCFTHDESTRMASGWGGDSYVIAEEQPKHIALLWTISWDDEASAEHFATELWHHAGYGCFDWKSSADHDGWQVDDHLAIRRSGAVVAIVRGVSDAGPMAEKATFQSPIISAPKPPLGDLRLKPDDGTWPVRGTFRDDEWGITAQIPSGLDASFLAALHQLRASGQSAKSWIILVVQDSGDSQSITEMMTKRVLASWSSLPSGSPEFAGERPYMSALGKGIERTWNVTAGGETVHFRYIGIPACENHAAFGFYGTWGKGADESLLQRLFESVRPIPGATSLWCAQRKATAVP